MICVVGEQAAKVTAVTVCTQSPRPLWDVVSLWSSRLVQTKGQQLSVPETVVPNLVLERALWCRGRQSAH